MPPPRQRKASEEAPAPRTTPYDDLWDLDKAPRTEEEDRKPRRIPPEPEPDILQFLFAYATDLEDWQRDIIAIVRQEQLYFLPQMQTKIMNEGWASYWHYKLMNDALKSAGKDVASFDLPKHAELSFGDSPNAPGQCLFFEPRSVRRLIGVACGIPERAIVRK